MSTERQQHRHAAVIALFFICGACLRIAFAQSIPPPAPVRPVTETLHGVQVTDPYRWMEDSGTELTDWMKAQDAYTRTVLDRIPGRQKLATELQALTTDQPLVTQPVRVGNHYFYLKRNAGEQVAKLYVRAGATGSEQVLMDPTSLGGATERFTIAEYGVSPDGRYVAFGVSPGGSGIGVAYVVEVATRHRLPDTIDRVFYFNSWRPDSRAFVYTRMRDLPPGAPPKDAELCPTTYLHLVGTAANTDQPLIGCGISSRIPITENQWGGVSFSTASTYALGWVALNPANTAFNFYTAPIETLSRSDVPWRPLASGDDQILDVLLRGDMAYLLTSRNAPHRQVVKTSLVDPDLARADVVVAQSDVMIAPPFNPNAVTSSALYMARDALYVRQRDAGSSRLLRVPFDNAPRSVIPLPFPGAVHDISTTAGEPGIVFVLESWMRAPRVYAFDPQAGTVRDLGLTSKNPAERPGFEVTSAKARSADGTLVPLTIIGRAGLKKDRSHPTRLQGYGAYGAVPEPTFRPSIVPWIERGGIDAICHVRGGGDYGEEWHRAGQKENKPNTIADFIACGGYLVTEGYTTSARLAGLGASAGGITIGGAITRRPDLFAAALPMVAVSDLLRYEFGRNGPQNIQEFGTVRDPNEFKALLSVSPYHHVTPGTRYPAVLATTSINDTSVPPWQVAKLVARLQAATISGKPVLLRVDWGAGHFGGTTASDQVSQLADMYSFMLWQMGIAGFQPTAQ